MKRFSLLIALFFALPAWGQFTTVTGTVTDPSSLPYANGTGRAQFNGSPNSVFTATGQPIGQQTIPLTLSTAGTFTVILSDNTKITPPNSTWIFSFCSAGGGVTPQVCYTATSPVTISGATQNVSTQASAGSVALPSSSGGGTIKSVFGRTTADIVATSGDYTCALVTSCITGLSLDQVTSPAAAPTFSLSTNVPVLFTAPGAFASSVALQDSLESIVTGGGACTAPGGVNHTQAINAIVCTPTSGVTNAWASGLSAYVYVNDPNQGGTFGKVEGVGVYPVCQASANNTFCIGAAPQVQDVAGKTGTRIEGMEIGVLPQNTTTVGTGLLMSFEGGTHQPTGDNMPGIVMQTPGGSATWTTGYECNDGSVSSAFCIQIGQTGTGANHASNAIGFKATDTGNNVNTGYFQYQREGLLMWNGTPAAFSLNSGSEASYGIVLTATAAQPHGTLVKIDTAHADSFVICTTSDTSCDGFVQGSNITGGLCIVSSTVCSVVTVPGSKVQGILGTGTCAIGNFVIVDTTTDGRVKCTGTPPTIGNVIGKALSIQASVGSTVDILTKFE